MGGRTEAVGANQDAGQAGDVQAATADLRRRRDEVRTAMGGAAKVERIHESGAYTVRERIERFLDAGTFREMGTFSESLRPADRGTTPGDGKIGGHGAVEGRPITVVGDDITVRRGSSSVVGSRKLHQLFDQALAAGNPIAYFGEAGGARIPDTIGAEGHTTLNAFPDYGRRMRRIPFVGMVMGQSFGGSSLLSALCDCVIQLRGSCLSITSPRVVEIATGEAVTAAELGGVDVHLRETGQIDLVAKTEDEAFALARRFLSYLPSNAWSPPPYVPQAGPPAYDAELERMVPERQQRAYDMRAVLGRVCDADSFLELQPEFGRALITGLARIDGHAVGIVASQPKQQAGAIGPDACDKAVRLITLCDSYGLPLVFLQDTPGFLVGKRAEHQRLLHKAMRFQQALVLASVPKLTVIVRKSFGLAHQVMNGANMDGDLVLAWPGAQVGFMDSRVGANIIHYPELSTLPEDERAARLGELAAEIAAGTDVYQAAGPLNIQEVIEPGETRAELAARLRQLRGRRPRPLEQRLLASWPTCG